MHDESDGRRESTNERLDRNWQDILQELRVALTGTQLISGFLLAVAFQSRFEDLTDELVVHYLVLVGLAALATLLGLAPVAVHRLLFGRRVKAATVLLGDRLLLATLVVVTLLVIGVAAFVFEFVAGGIAGLVAAIVAAVVASGMWALGLGARARSGD
ncbi:hypothetical protein GCM10009846_23220 [Agrococcus versicolor]|uniref:Sodium:proton antiporter n=1 Tax=Agrococcus versicolor TaxID=501482 RepID=A0ABP5MK44_9MICO